MLEAENDDLRRKLALADQKIKRSDAMPKSSVEPLPPSAHTPLATRLRKSTHPQRRVTPQLRRRLAPKPPKLRRVEEVHSARFTLTLQPVWNAIRTLVLSEYEKWVGNVHRDMPKVVGDSTRLDDEFATMSLLFDRIRVGILGASHAKREAEITAVGINTQNEQQVKEPIRRVLKVDPFQHEPWLVPMAQNWVTENTSLIKSVEQSFLGDVEQIVFRMVRQGASKKDTMEALMKRFELSKNRARLIARDQVNKFNGQLTQARQTQAGIKEYIWHTAQDRRVRGTPGGAYPKAKPSHYVMEGVRCRWDDSTVYFNENRKKWVKRTQQMPHEHPGQPIQCRCWAEPDLKELLAA